VGTFLGGDAVVTFPGTEGDLEMWSDPETEIQLPPSEGGKLELIRGRIYVEWYKYDKKAIGKICADTSICIDPEFAVFKLDYNAERKTADAEVYGGQIIVSRPEAMDQVLLPWQRATFVPKVAAEIKAVTRPPAAKVADRLAEIRLATSSPWQPLDLELERDPALDVIDPRFVADSGSQQVYLQLMEGLFSFDAEGDVVLAGAVEYEVSDDGLAHVLTLRPDALWSDEMPVISEHYVDGICRVAAPESEAPQANELYLIKGLQEFHGGYGSCEDIGVRIIDDYTLEIRTIIPLADLGSALATPLAYPARLDVIEECGDRWTEPDCFVSNGRYMLNAWEHGEFLNLMRNPHYWDTENVKPERLEFSIR